jgi:hypothetical protein
VQLLFGTRTEAVLHGSSSKSISRDFQKLTSDHENEMVHGNGCRLISFFLLQAAVPHNNYKAAFIFKHQSLIATKK